MADFGSNPLSALYPQPPQLQPNGQINLLASNPLGLLQLGSQMAVGRAYQNALSPNGTFDQGAFASGIASSPIAALDAPAAASLRARGIAANTGQFDLLSGQNNFLQNYIGALGPNASADEVRSIVLGAAARAGVPPQVSASTLAGLPEGGPELQRWIADRQNAAIGPTPNRVTLPGPGGVSQSYPQSTVVRAGGAGLPANYPPGYTGALASNQQAFVNDQQSSAGILANTRQLQTALPLIAQLGSSNFGPGSPEFAQIKGALTTAGIIDPNTSDLQVRQEAGKYLLKYAFGAINAGRSDQALSAAIHSNPNLDLTQPANLSLLKNQVAMDRMDAAIPLTAPQDRSQYLTYKSNFYQNNDQRAFSFDLMTPTERRQVIDSLGSPNSPAYKKFARSYALAKQSGMITPQNSANGQ